MRQNLLLVACVCSCLAVISASPVPAGGDRELDVLQIPLPNGKELDVLTIGTKDQEQAIAERNKRTIGLLRELFPEITQSGATDTQIDLSAINKQLEETIRVARQVKEAEEAAAQLQQKNNQLPIPDANEPIQLSFNNELSQQSSSSSSSSNSNSNTGSSDLSLSESKSPAIDELTLDSNEDTAELDDRNKRFLSLGGGLAGGASGGATAGKTGGSGNFLFDVLRLFSGSVQTQTSDDDAAASGTGNSVSDSDSDSDANRAADGYTEGIPGPVTRLVVLVNRGFASLIQDLILRVAATSEKFVNFKAKLITALI